MRLTKIAHAVRFACIQIGAEWDYQQAVRHAT